MLPQSTLVNLKRSFYSLFYDAVEVGKSKSGLVSYGDYLFNTEDKTEWIVVDVLDIGTALKGDSQTVQVTCVRRMISEDPQNLGLDQLVDDVRDALNINEFTIYDYADVDAPVEIIETDSHGDPYTVTAALRNTGPNPRQPTLDGVSSHVLNYSIYLWREDIIQ